MELLPAYDFGYLLRKLPSQTTIFKKDKEYRASLMGTATDWRSLKCYGDTPEDAACYRTRQRRRLDAGRA
jgi:hypothetical protein